MIATTVPKIRPTAAAPLVGIVALLALVVAVLYLLGVFERDPDSGVEVVSDSRQAVHDDYELGIGMAWLQRWVTKLWYAGDAGHWELADFYLHETEETLEDMIAAGVVEDGHDISALIQGMLIPQIEALETAVDEASPDLFRRHYQAMVVQCNACHVATEHGFLVMDIPSGPPPFAQNFAP